MSRTFTLSFIALLTVLGIVGGVTLYGDNIRKLFGASSTSLAGSPEAGPSRKAMRSFGVKSPDAQPVAASRAPAAAEPLASGNTHTRHEPNAFTLTREDRLSTFAVDVDTASYSLFRRAVQQENQLPHPSSVRVEEWVNAFRYRLPEPRPDEGDFHVDLEMAPSPFSMDRHLLKVGLQGRRVAKSQRKPTHLVFLVDTSGSMSGEDRLELAKKAMKLAVGGLNETDTVAITTYAGDVRTVLETTPASERGHIEDAIDSLCTGGGTAMGDGLELAYQHAVRMVGADNVSRVVVLTDGDTNLGKNLTADAMLESVARYVRAGVTLSTIGFGMGNYRDDLMERLADKGNGNSFYIDSEREARKVFQEQLAGTLEVIAQDVKVQVDFEPDAVRGYRLVGYENRDVADKDFRDDRVDGGEIGVGHSVTALYEVELTGEGTRLATVRVRAKRPRGEEAAEQRFTLERHQVHASLAEASSDLRFAAAVAGTADLLRGAREASGMSLETAESLVEDALDDQQDREEFLSLLRRVRSILPRNNWAEAARKY
ncbi:vWA domain-containing protein [Pyxidicoccus sp. MSG2]|uniref:vWA domain-containing protein n=1 Tax=Pyxidicoccus sp. MSG2 TaxID=2996790 RepID=UPI00226D5E09|nr:von Willebrand factor type A domain-containing protein [Pyxidicoccus sp. MSG2]MCY1019917.1 von Willebrand factor type A domain-containing protein [Pyxidicoccus sp. MSG2]